MKWIKELFFNPELSITDVIVLMAAVAVTQYFAQGWVGFLVGLVMFVSWTIFVKPKCDRMGMQAFLERREEKHNANL